MTESHNLSFPYRPKEHYVASLSDDFLNALVAELDSGDIIGITLGGSQARGEDTPYSDVDLACWIREDVKQPLKRMIYRDGHLVSVGFKKMADVRRDLTKPQLAIWIASSFSTRRTRLTLLDKDGSVTAFMQEIASFRWEPLQNSADFFASNMLILLAEMSHKLLSELWKQNDLGLSYATADVLYGLTEAVATQRGVMVKTNATYYQQVEETVGLDSAWTMYHRQVAGVGTPSTIQTRGRACLRLYQETARLLWDILLPEHRETIEKTLTIIDAAL